MLLRDWILWKRIIKGPVLYSCVSDVGERVYKLESYPYNVSQQHRNVIDFFTTVWGKFLACHAALSNSSKLQISLRDAKMLLKLFFVSIFIIHTSIRIDYIIFTRAAICNRKRPSYIRRLYMSRDRKSDIYLC